jgi:hypothetical protein
MPVKPIHLGIFASLIAATSACSSSDEEEFDCLSLGGGYEGEDLEAPGAEPCAARRGTGHLGAVGDVAALGEARRRG